MNEKTAKQFIMDAYGYLHWCMNEGKLPDHGLIATTLLHDICGIARGEAGFSPRVTGYAKHIPAAEKLKLGI